MVMVPVGTAPPLVEFRTSILAEKYVCNPCVCCFGTCMWTLVPTVGSDGYDLKP